MKIWLHIRKKGISPLIATILLIALVVAAGAITFLVLSGIMFQETPVDLEIAAISDFRSENDDIRVDRFTVSVKSLNTQSAVIKRDEIKVFNKTAMDVELTGWRILGTTDEFFISGKETINLVLYCLNPNHELLPRADRIQVQMNAYRSSGSDIKPKVIKSPIVVVGQTYGPLSISTESISLGTLEWNLTLNIRNNGTTDLDLIVELQAQDPFFFNGSAYITRYIFELEGADIGPGSVVTLGPELNLNWNVTATAGLASGTYYIVIRITDSAFRPMGFILVPLEV